MYNNEESEVIQTNLAKSGPDFPPSNVDATIEAVVAQAAQKYDEHEIATEPENTINTAMSDKEQLWCICNKVASGEMIACDNEKCVVEWFHFQCVNISRAPRGKWFCQKYSGGSSKR